MATVAGFFVKIGASTRDFDRAVGGVRRSLKGLDDDTRKMVKGFGADLAAEAVKSREALVRGLVDEGAFAARGRAAAIAFNAGIMGEIDRLRASGALTDQALGSLLGQLRPVSSTLEDAARGMDRFGRSATSTGKVLSVAITAPLTALGFLAARAAVNSDSLARGLEAVTGDAAEAGRQLERLRDVARLPGLGFDEAVQGSIRLQAVGISAKLSERTLRAVGNALATVGSGRTELDGTIVALTRIASKGRVAARDIDAIALRVPQIRRVMEEAFGTSSAEKIQQLGITADQFIERVVGGLEKLPRATGGWRGTLENVGDTLSAVMDKIGRQFMPLVDRGAKAIDRMLERVEALNPQVIRWGVALAAVAAIAGPLILVVGKLAVGVAALATAIGVGLLPLVAAGAPILVGLGLLAAMFVKIKMDAAAAAGSVKTFEERLAGMSADQVAGATDKLTDRRDWLLKRIKRLRESAQHATGGLKGSIERDIAKLSGELGRVLVGLSQAQARAAEIAGVVGGAATAAVGPALDRTYANLTKLIDAQKKVQDEIDNLRFEMVLTPAGDAWDSLNAKLGEAQERLQAIRREMGRFSDSVPAGADVSMAGVGQSIRRGIPIRAQKMGPATPAAEKAQAQLERWLANPHITIASLERDPEFRAMVEALKRDRERREAIEKAAGVGGGEQKGFLEQIMGAKSLGEAFGAVKSMIVASLKAAGPLIVVLEVVKGIMSALGEPLQALLLPLRMLGETIGKALLPIIKALWPVIKWLTIAVSYSAQALFVVAGWLFKAIGEVITGLGKVVKWLTFGVVKQLEEAGKGMRRMGGEMLGAADDMGDLRRDLKNMSFEDALDRVSDSANKAADSLLNVPTGFKVAFARFQAARPEATVPYPGGTPSATPKGGTTTVQNHVPVTIHVHASERTDTRVLVQDIVRELQREANRGGVTGLELVFG